jgi:uncharacterized protein (TIGR00297 family)
VPLEPHDDSARRHSEVARKWVHILFGVAALGLPLVPWWQAASFVAAAVLFNIALLRRLTARRLHRPNELDRRLPAGLVLYPTSVLLLLLLLPTRPDIVGAAWAILAAGDGAATLVGRRFGVTRWRWNTDKSIAGSIAFVVIGTAAGSALAWWCRPAVVPPPYWWFSIAAPAIAALTAAAVETVPIRLNDNLSVPLTAATVMWTLSMVSEDLARSALQDLPALLPAALAANVAVASVGYAARTVSQSGAIVGALIGTLVHLSTGWPGWILLLVTFGCAAAASRIGRDRKNALGIAEPNAGRRGAGNAIANTGVATVAGVLSVVSYADTAGLLVFSAALTAAASDTIASELGKATGGRTWAILPPRRVPPGTPGAMSLAGTIAGVIGASALAWLAVLLGLAPTTAFAAIVVSATLGSLVESLLGATFEPVGILNNDALNLINTAVAAYAAVSLAQITP